MSVFLLCCLLLAALLHASWNIVVKGGDDKLAETGLTALGGLLGGLCLLPFAGPLAPAAWPFLVFSSLCHFCYYRGVAAAYEKADLAFGYTVMRGCAPLFTAVAVSLAGLPPSGLALLGVAVLCGGIWLLAFDNARRGGGWRGLGPSLRAALCITAYTLADGMGARRGGDGWAYACWIFIAQFVPITLWLLWRHGRGYLRYARARLLPGLAGGAASFVSYGVAIWAMTRASIAVVAAVRETSVVFGMLLAVWFLGERFTGLRAGAVVAVACGAILLKLS